MSEMRKMYLRLGSEVPSSSADGISLERLLQSAEIALPSAHEVNSAHASQGRRPAGGLLTALAAC